MSMRRRIISLIINAYLVISTLIITLSNLLSKRPADSARMGFRGVENLIYYTVDSNIFMSLCAIVVIILLVKSFRSSSHKTGTGSAVRTSSMQHPAICFPGWLHIVILAAAVSVGVTFATVAFFLSPGQAILGRGYFSLFTGTNLFFHLINPLLGCADFIWFIPHRHYSVPECLFGVIPTAIYGAVYTICVVFVRVWPDIYNFTFGGHFELAPVPIIVILAMSFGIAVLLTRLHNRFGPGHSAGRS